MSPQFKVHDILRAMLDTYINGRIDGRQHFTQMAFRKPMADFRFDIRHDKARDQPPSSALLEAWLSFFLSAVRTRYGFRYATFR